MEESRREELDKQYSCSKWTKRGTPGEVLLWHVSKTKEGTQKARITCKCDLDVAYGDHEREKFDVYYPDGPPHDWPVLIYLHGGFWQVEELSKNTCGFMANAFTKAGCVVVALGYPLACNMSLSEVIERACSGVKAIQKKFSKSRIFLCGHSAGAHLACMIISSGDKVDAVKGVFLVSGIYDLRPLEFTKTVVNNHLIKMNEKVASECSPMNYVSEYPRACKTLIVVGENDSPAFKEQKIEFSKALRKAGVEYCEEMEIPVVDHFDLIENLENSDYELTQKILSIIRN